MADPGGAPAVDQVLCGQRSRENEDYLLTDAGNSELNVPPEDWTRNWRLVAETTDDEENMEGSTANVASAGQCLRLRETQPDDEYHQYWAEVWSLA